MSNEAEELQLESLGDQIAAEDELNDDLTGDDLEDEEYSPAEIEAMSNGWTSKEEWVNKGKDPDEWRTARQFNEFGEMRRMIRDQGAQIDGMKRSHNEEISGLNILHRKQLEDREADLSKSLEEAVDEGDTEKAASILEEHKNITLEKRELDSSNTQESAQDMLVLKGEWEANNPWVFEDTPKSRAANSAFQLARAKNLSMADTLSFVDDRMAGFDSGTQAGSKRVNLNRSKAALASSGGAAASHGNKNRGLTMSDITESEMKYRDLFASGEDGDKLFLKTIENNRKGG